MIASDLTSTGAGSELLFQELGLDQIEESKTNPAARIKGPQFDELIESIRIEGVLEPILVRFLGDGRYRVVFGSRRFAAAKAAGRNSIPAIVRELTDEQELEIQLIENLHRQDLHPLEEAQGYHLLSRKPGYDVAKIAARVGRSPKYVYDRIKLLALTKEAKEHFLEGRFAAGHAILLARLTPEDQARALSDREEACFQVERIHDLFADDEAERQKGDGLKARSVRELEAWITRNVRFEPERDADPMLFPETAAALGEARKVVPITFSSYIPEAARDPKHRTYFPQSWARADGEKKSKTCEHSVLGYVAAGPHRGESFEVCVNKDKCEVHWGALIRARKKRAAAAPASTSENGAQRSAPAERREDPKLVAALNRARELAGDRIIAEVTEAAAKMSADLFLRVLAAAVPWRLRGYLNHHKIKLTGDKGIKHWCAHAPRTDVQAAIAFGEVEDGDEAAEAFGVDVAKIEKEEESKARAALKPAVQTSAKREGAAKDGAKRKTAAAAGTTKARRTGARRTKKK